MGVTSGPSTSEPVLLDLGDFDAVGVMSDVVVALRAHALDSGVDATATVSAPERWHRAFVTARPGGNMVLGVRYGELTSSRWHNVAKALGGRGWQLDEDGEGATLRFPPGTDATAPAFEVLAVLTVSGAPADTRQVTAADAAGAPVSLVPPGS